MNEITDIEASYIAGIIDGEGSIIVGRKRVKTNRSGYEFYPNVSLINTSKKMMDYVADTTGLGKVREKTSPSTLAKHRRRSWTWQIRSRVAEKFLKRILPFLVVKQDSAQNAIEFYENFPSSVNFAHYNIERHEYFWLKSKKLNARGEYLDPDKAPITQHGAIRGKEPLRVICN